MRITKAKPLLNPIHTENTAKNDLFTWSELQMAKIYWKTMVCVLKLKNPKIHVTPKMGNKINDERNPVLEIKRKIIYDNYLFNSGEVTFE